MRGGWLTKMVPLDIKIIYRMGEISEDFYHGHTFLIDFDANGFEYKLVSTAHHFTQSNVL